MNPAVSGIPCAKLCDQDPNKIIKGLERRAGNPKISVATKKALLEWFHNEPN
jgi:hypothetical protein